MSLQQKMVKLCERESTVHTNVSKFTHYINIETIGDGSEKIRVGLETSLREKFSHLHT